MIFNFDGLPHILEVYFHHHPRRKDGGATTFFAKSWSVCEFVVGKSETMLTEFFQYLDCGQGQWLDFAPGAAAEAFYPYADYCSPRHNWRVMYAYDPLEGVPSNLSHLVLGGEAHIWSEQTDPVSLDRMVWPRACAAAEVLWSGAKDAQGQNRSHCRRVQLLTYNRTGPTTQRSRLLGR